MPPRPLHTMVPACKGRSHPTHGEVTQHGASTKHEHGGRHGALELPGLLRSRRHRGPCGAHAYLGAARLGGVGRPLPTREERLAALRVRRVAEAARPGQLGRPHAASGSSLRDARRRTVTWRHELRAQALRCAATVPPIPQPSWLHASPAHAHAASPAHAILPLPMPKPPPPSPTHPSGLQPCVAWQVHLSLTLTLTLSLTLTLTLTLTPTLTLTLAQALAQALTLAL